MLVECYPSHPNTYQPVNLEDGFEIDELAGA